MSPEGPGLYFTSSPLQIMQNRPRSAPYPTTCSRTGSDGTRDLESTAIVTTAARAEHPAREYQLGFSKQMMNVTR